MDRGLLREPGYDVQPRDGTAYVDGGHCGRRTTRGGSLAYAIYDFRSAQRNWAIMPLPARRRRRLPRRARPAGRGMMDALAWIEQTRLSRVRARGLLRLFRPADLPRLGHGVPGRRRHRDLAAGARRGLGRAARAVPRVLAGDVARRGAGGRLRPRPARRLSGQGADQLDLRAQVRLPDRRGAAGLAHRARGVPGPRGEPIPPRARWMAAAALALWLGGVACGKLLLYTNTMLLTTDLEW